MWLRVTDVFQKEDSGCEKDEEGEEGEEEFGGARGGEGEGGWHSVAQATRRSNSRPAITRPHNHG